MEKNINVPYDRRLDTDKEDFDDVEDNGLLDYGQSDEVNVDLDYSIKEDNREEMEYEKVEEDYDFPFKNLTDVSLW